MNCREMEDKLMDLLEPGSQTGAAADHVAGCANCAAQLAEMRMTFAALDEWEAPEVSTWFDGKLHARLREEMQRQPEGFFERLRARFTFGASFSWKPLAAGAMAVVLAAGAGTVGIHKMLQHTPAQSVAVQDLQRLDTNAAALQDMDQLDADGASDDVSDSSS